jgi:hypothetical protein
MKTTSAVHEWPQLPLRTVAERIFLGLADARQRGQDSEKALPVLNVRDIRDGHVPAVGLLAKRTVTRGVDVNRYIVRADDVVITCRGTQLRIANITPQSAGALISANLIAIRPGTELLPAVLLAFLHSPATQKSLLQRAQSSTASISLTTKLMGELAIPVPPISVQTQIAELIISAEQNYVAAIHAAEQRRAVARAVAFDLIRGKPGRGKRNVDEGLQDEKGAGPHKQISRW